jgi:hypothetical protein
LVRKSLETYDASDFVVGCTIELGTWTIEIEEARNVDDYISGRIFLQQPTLDILSICFLFFLH